MLRGEPAAQRADAARADDGQAYILTFDDPPPPPAIAEPPPGGAGS